MLASGVLAWLTFRFVEKPIRFGWAASRAPLWLSAAMGAIACFSIQQWISGSDRHDPLSEYVSFYRNYPHTHDLRTNYGFECGFIDARGKPRAMIDPRCVAADGRPVVFLWGDSHAQALRYGLVKSLPSTVELMQVATFGCHPVLKAGESNGGAACDRSNEFALETIRRVKPAVVILAQQSQHQLTDWGAIATTLRMAGVERVILAGPSPEWTPNLYRIMVKDFVPPRPMRLATHHVDEIQVTDRWLSQHYAHSDQLTYASLYDLLCDAQGCLTYLGADADQGLTTFDFGHLTLAASDYVADHLLIPLVRSYAPERAALPP